MILPITRHIALSLHVISAPWLGVLLIKATTTTTAQTIYKVVDEQGNVTFTDTSPSGAVAEDRSINATNTTSALQSSGDIIIIDTEVARAVDGQPFEPRTTAPAHRAAIPMGPGNFVVEVSVSPALGTEGNLALTPGGAPVGAPQQSASWQFNNISQGEQVVYVMRSSVRS